jgi:AraC-like DNA-binding protein
VIGDRRYDVTKGGVFIYHRRYLRIIYYVLSEKPDIYWIHFSGWELRVLTGLGLTSEQPILLQARRNSRIVEKIIIELRLDRFQRMEMTEAYLRQLFIMIARLNQTSERDRMGYHSMLDQVMNQFHHEYQSEINIAEYAKRNHISCSWFIREFKKYTGYSPKQYITNLRLQHAKELLHNHSLPISEIATLVGYEDQLYFSRIFRKYTGSPQENTGQKAQPDIVGSIFDK